MRRGVLVPGMLFVLVAASAVQADGEWQESRSRHFNIYYKDAPSNFVRNVEEAAERYYEEITRDLGFTRYRGWSFDERAKIYIYQDQDDYVRSSFQAGWSHGAANARLKIIRTFPSAHGFFDSTLPHELGHIIFREFVGHSTVLPAWVDEGVAMFQEKARRWGANRHVKRAMAEGRFLSLTELSLTRLTRSSSEQDVDLFYAESASIIYFMVTELGEYRFVNFCRKLKDGMPFIEAMRRAYGRFDTLEDLNKAWVDYLKDQ